MAVVGIVLVAVVLVGLHWYVWRRVVRDTTAERSLTRRAGSAVFVLGPVLMVGALVTGHSAAPFWLQRALAWPGFLWMALALYLLLTVLVGEAVGPLLRRVLERRPGPAAAVPQATPSTADTAAPNPSGPPVASPVDTGATPAGAGTAPGDGTPVSPAGAGTASPVDTGATPAGAGTPPGDGTAQDPPRVPTSMSDTAQGPPRAATPTSGAVQDRPVPRPSRRLFVSRIIGSTAAAVAVGTVGYGTYSVLRGPAVKHVTVPLARLPRSAHGFRIAVVSDIHLGPILGRSFTRRVVDTINGTRPDLIAVVGDLVDGSVAELGAAAEPLSDLRAPFGAYFVTGNHEYYSGAAQWVAQVREFGLTPLENERTELPGFDLAGVNDVQGASSHQGPDFGKALGDRDRARTAVLLAHQPVVIHDAVRHGVDLQLSGHTHGGQLWPGNYLAELANPTVAGLERYGDTQLYVTRGAGAWGPPVRVGAPSDITVVELASKQA